MILKVYLKDKMLELILQSQSVKIYVILFDIMNSSITRLYYFALPPAICDIVGFPTVLLTECCQGSEFLEIVVRKTVLI